MRDDATGGAGSMTGVDTRALYEGILAGERRQGTRGNVVFCASSDDLSLSRGDLYVSLGLARALSDDGWGVSVLPISKMTEPTPVDVDVAIVMVESFVPGYVAERTKLVAWVRNWTDEWAALPYLSLFAQVWCSSEASAARIREVFTGEVVVVPLATDPRMFHEVDVERTPSLVTTANFWGVPRQIEAALQQVAGHGIPVTWYGVNSRFLQLTGDVDHRDAIDYFRLPEVYSAHAIVVDDLIEQAARYGNQNSRLFDALACGAAVIVNSATGLDELGLGEIPVYTDGDDLSQLASERLSDLDGLAVQVARLREHVLAHHTWAARAETVRAHLAALVSDDTVQKRPDLLRWVTDVRHELRETRTTQDYYSTSYVDASRELDRALHELEGERRVRAHWAHRLVDKLAAVRHGRDRPNS